LEIVLCSQQCAQQICWKIRCLAASAHGKERIDQSPYTFQIDNPLLGQADSRHEIFSQSQQTAATLRHWFVGRMSLSDEGQQRNHVHYYGPSVFVCFYLFTDTEKKYNVAFSVSRLFLLYNFSCFILIFCFLSAHRFAVA
jgi:hypothetical protein